MFVGLVITLSVILAGWGVANYLLASRPIAAKLNLCGVTLLFVVRSFRSFGYSKLRP